MATKLHLVSKAQKDYPNAGIKKGESYFWWKFRHGGKHMSKTRPKPSQLENSPFQSSLMAASEVFDDNFTNFTDLESACDQVKEDLQELADQAQESFDNMPDGLQQGDTGQLLENRASEVESLIGEFDGLDFECDQEDDENLDEGETADEKEAAKVQSLIEEIQGFNWSIE